MSPSDIAVRMSDKIRGEVRTIEIPATFVVKVAAGVDVAALYAVFPVYLAEVVSVVLDGDDLLGAGLPFAVVEVKEYKR